MARTSTWAQYRASASAGGVFPIGSGRRPALSSGPGAELSLTVVFTRLPRNRALQSCRAQARPADRAIEAIAMDIATMEGWWFASPQVDSLEFGHIVLGDQGRARID